MSEIATRRITRAHFGAISCVLLTTSLALAGPEGWGWWWKETLTAGLLLAWLYLIRRRMVDAGLGWIPFGANVALLLACGGICFYALPVPVSVAAMFACIFLLEFPLALFRGKSVDDRKDWRGEFEAGSRD